MGHGSHVLAAAIRHHPARTRAIRSSGKPGMRSSHEDPFLSTESVSNKTRTLLVFSHCCPWPGGVWLFFLHCQPTTPSLPWPACQHAAGSGSGVRQSDLWKNQQQAVVWIRPVPHSWPLVPGPHGGVWGEGEHHLPWENAGSPSEGKPPSCWVAQLTERRFVVNITRCSGRPSSLAGVGVPVLPLPMFL